VDAAVGVAARFLAAHGIGRGQPVDRAVLEQSGAVSERFIDEVTKLARAVKGDARALIAALESGQVARFHTNKREELRDALEASGHLDPATPLAPEALRARALAGLAPGTAGAGGLDLAGAQRLVDWLEKLLDEPG